MTIVRLNGGLGNQMFQYAVGVAAAKLAQRELYLDLSAFDRQPEKDTPRQFGLMAFNISHTQRRDHIDLPGARFLRRAIGKLFPSDPYRFYPRMLHREFLDGYFQNERYFLGIKDALHKEYELRQVSARFSRELEAMREANGLSVHVRRGDYISNSYARSFHGVLDIAYFERAYRCVVERVGRNVPVFVFTDDVEWARSSIDFPTDVCIASGQGFSDAEELVLMSACAHHIISNSSFSWWGAWLNRRIEKTVVGPRQWTLKRSASGIMPPSWIAI